jgi:parvulin-like peptidyl-prolyl isomerase
MDAAIPLCRFLLLGAALTAAIGCKSNDLTARPRAQMPQDPLAPVAPPPPPNLPASPTPLLPNSPTPPSPGVSPAVPGAPVVGSPVQQAGAKGPVVPTGYSKTLPNAADLLKNSVPRVKVVAIVGANNVITDQEVLESVWQHNDQLVKLDGREREAKIKELYTVALRKTIERELILDDMYAKLKKNNKHNVIEELRELSSSMTDRQIREMKKNIGCQTDEEFATWLRLQGLTVPVLRRQFERQIMAQQYVNSMMKDKGRRAGLAEIRDYYDKHPEEFQTPDRVKWLHVFVSLNRHPTPQAALNQAEAIRQKAAVGEDFAALAKQYDEGFAKMQNGFGTGELRGKIQPPDIEETVWSLKPGQMSGVVQTATGYHIVKVVERDVAGVQPFDIKVQGKIRDKLNDGYTEVEMKKLVEDLWRKGVVRVMND